MLPTGSIVQFNVFVAIDWTSTLIFVLWFWLLNSKLLVIQRIHVFQLFSARQLVIDEADQNDQSNPMLVKYPRAANVAGKPLLTTLFYCCMYHWESGESHPGSPVALRKAHDLTTRQLLWTVMRGRARVHHWPLPQELDAWRDNKVCLIRGGFYHISSLLLTVLCRFKGSQMPHWGFSVPSLPVSPRIICEIWALHGMRKITWAKTTSVRWKWFIINIKTF